MARAVRARHDPPWGGGEPNHPSVAPTTQPQLRPPSGPSPMPAVRERGRPGRSVPDHLATAAPVTRLATSSGVVGRPM